MQKQSIFKCKIITIFIFYIFFATQSYGLQNKILFKVNNEIITSIDLLDEVEYIKLLNTNLNNLSKEKLFEIAKRSIIKEKIQKLQIQKLYSSTEVEKKYLDLLLKEFIRKVNLNSKEELQKLINSKGIKMERILEKIKTEILWNQIIVNKFSKKIKINKQKIRENIISNNFQKSYLLAEIVFNLESETLNEKYEIIKNEIFKNGFNNAASIFSISESAKDGGKIGWIKLSSLNDKIKQEIISINKSEFTKPILIPGGFIILKIEDEKKIKIVDNIEDEVESISRVSANKQLNQFSNIYFNKIKKEFDIDEL